MDTLRNKMPPQFGHAALEYFTFEPGYINVNHGAYGSLPRPVADACQAMAAESEGNPDRWNRVTYHPLLTNVRQRVAALIGADTDECVLVPNTSHGVSTVLRNIEWHAGDIIVSLNMTYYSVARTARYIADTPPHPSVAEFSITFPTTPAAIVSQFQAHLRSLPRTPGQQVVAIIDGIVSLPAIYLPWREMVRVCREEGVLSLIDAAHAIGQETGLNLHAVDPDFWVSNCHKWLYAKRSCALLYVPLRNQHLIKTTFPTAPAYLSPSDRKGPNFVEQFDWTATIDWIPFLSVAAALDFRQWLGGEEKINAYCREIATQARKKVADILGTAAVTLDPTGQMTLNMFNVHLPLQPSLQPHAEVLEKIKQKTLIGARIFAPVYFIEGLGWWARCSAQIFNEVEDFEKLARVLLSVCAEIENELASENRKENSKL